MPQTLDEIVRPFTDGNITPPKAGTLSIPQVVPPVIVIAGGSGNGKIISGSFDEVTTVYVIKTPQEPTQ